MAATDAGRAGGAYVELVPRLADGFEKQVSSSLEGPLAGVGAKASALGGTLTKSLTLPIIAGATLAGGALVAAGKQIDDALDNISIKTGETGETLDSLQGSFRNVAARVPDDMGRVSDAIAELHSRTGATGPGLEGLATQVLTLSRLTGTDLSTTIEQSTRLFGDWSIAADDQGAALDRLFTLSQKTGVGVDSLSSSLVQFGGPMRQLGFSMDESAALIAKFQKEGVNTELVLGSMRQALGKMAKAGEEPVETLGRTIDAIKGAGSAGEANALALELFGARAGPDMAAAIREGRFEIDDLVAVMGTNENAIAKSAASTDGFSETFGRLKNSIILAVEPLATKLFSALDQLVPKLQPVIDFVGKLIEAIVNLDPKWQLAIAGLIGVAAAVGPVLSLVGFLAPVIGALLSPIGLVVAAIAGLVVGVIYAYTHFEGFRDVVDGVVDWLVTNVPPLIGRVVDFITETFGALLAYVQRVWPSIKESIDHVLRVVKEIVGGFVDVVSALWRAWGDDLLRIASTIFDYVKQTIENVLAVVRGIIQTVTALINGDWGKAWDGIKQIVGAVWDQIKNIVSTAIDLVKSTIGGVLSTIGEVWSGIWDKLKGVASGALDGVVGFVRDLPGRILGYLGSIGSAFLSIGTEAVKKLGEGLSGAISLAGDIAEAVGRAVKGAINHVIDLLNDAIPNSLGWGPAKIDLPDNPIPKLHDGGVFDSGRGEGLALLRDGERVLTPEQDRDLAGMLAGGAGGFTYAPAIDARGAGPGVESLIARALEHERDELVRLLRSGVLPTSAP